MSDDATIIRKLVRLAASGDTEEARTAARTARRKIEQLNTELLSTLEGQRQRLVEELRLESHRLIYERATKQDTGELITSAGALLRHYQKNDVLIAAIMLARIESGHRLTVDELQQLEGPVVTWLDRWSSEVRERRRQARAERAGRADG